MLTQVTLLSKENKPVKPGSKRKHRKGNNEQAERVEKRGDVLAADVLASPPPFLRNFADAAPFFLRTHRSEISVVVRVLVSSILLVVRCLSAKRKRNRTSSASFVALVFLTVAAARGVCLSTAFSYAYPLPSTVGGAQRKGRQDTQSKRGANRSRWRPSHAMTVKGVST